MSDLKSAKEVRDLMQIKFKDEITESKIMELIESAALKGEFEIEIPCTDYSGNFELIDGKLRELGYGGGIHFYHCSNKDAWVLFITWHYHN